MLAYTGQCALCGRDRRHKKKCFIRSGRIIPDGVFTAWLPHYTSESCRLCNRCNMIVRRTALYQQPMTTKIVDAVTTMIGELHVGQDNGHNDVNVVMTVSDTNSDSDMDVQRQAIILVCAKWRQTSELAGIEHITTAEQQSMAVSVSTGWGESTPHGLHRLIAVLRDFDMTTNSHFMDIGSGFGRVPALIANLFHCRSSGIEVMESRHRIGMDIATSGIFESSIVAKIKLIHGDILHHLSDLFDVTHIYSFDWVIPSTVKTILLHLLAFMSPNESQVKVFITTIDSIPVQYGRLMHMI